MWAKRYSTASGRKIVKEKRIVQGPEARMVGSKVFEKKDVYKKKTADNKFCSFNNIVKDGAFF